MSFINIEVEGKEYTLVDEFDDCGKDKIYCFAGDEDDIFCIKKNEKYLTIKDEKLIKEVKEKHNLILKDILYKKKDITQRVKEKLTGTVEIDDQTKEAFIDEVVCALKGYFPDFDESKAKKRLNEVKIYITDKLPNKNGVVAYYKYADDAMFFSKENILSKDIGSKRTRLHETIHSLYYVESKNAFQEGNTDAKKKNDMVNRPEQRDACFREGATEELVENIYASDNKDIISSGFDRTSVLSKNCYYLTLVSLIKQIKFITGQDTREFLFSGNDDIFQEALAEKCGKDEVHLIRYLANKFITSKDKKKDINEMLKENKEAIELIQYEFLKSFDREFNEEVHSVQTAEKFLSRLKEFDKLRICIKGNENFKSYYSGKIHEILKMLEKQGIPENEIIKFYEKHHYKGWIENIYENKEIKEYNIKINFFSFMSINQNIDPNKVRLFYKLENGVETYGIMDENGYMGINTISYEKEDSYISNLSGFVYSMEDFEEVHWDEKVKKEFEEYRRRVKDKESKNQKSDGGFFKRNVLNKVKRFFYRNKFQKLLPESSIGNTISNKSKRRGFMRELSGGGEYRKTSFSERTSSNSRNNNEEQREDDIEL